MNRSLRTVLVSAAVLLSGTVAFAVAGAITPPDIDSVDVVVTDRPVLSAAAITVFPATAPALSPAPVGRADKPASDSSAPSVKNKTTSTGSDSVSEPKRIVIPAAKPKPPAVNVDTETEHEVVTPPVRDEEDDEDDSDDESKNDSPSPSADFDPDQSEGTTLRSGSKGD